MSSITDGVISTDLAGGIVEANEAALHLIGLKREALVGTTVDDHLEFFDEMTRSPLRQPGDSGPHRSGAPAPCRFPGTRSFGQKPASNSP